MTPLRAFRPVVLLLGLALTVAAGARAAADSLPAPEAPASAVVGLTVGFVDIRQMDGEVDTIVLGDPSIADASPLDSRTIILTGLEPGTTNMIVLDAGGGVLAEMLLRVSARQPGNVTVRRALATQVYSCSTGFCEGPPGPGNAGAAPGASAPTAPAEP